MINEDFTANEWTSMKVELATILKNAATHKQIVYYSDLIPKMTTFTFDFEEPYHRNLMAELLGSVSTDEHKEGRPLLSAIVCKKTGVLEPGQGFFDLAEDLGRLKGEKMGFWQFEVRKVFEEWEA